MPPSWILWLMVGWYTVKLAFFLFAVAAKIVAVSKLVFRRDSQP